MDDVFDGSDLASVYSMTEVTRFRYVNIFTKMYPKPRSFTKVNVLIV